MEGDSAGGPPSPPAEPSGAPDTATAPQPADGAGAGTKTVTRTYTTYEITFEIPRWLFWSLLGLVAIVIVGLCLKPLRSILPKSVHTVPPDIMEDLGMAGVIMFRQHDRDDDGYLSLEEFEPIAHRMLDTNMSYNQPLPIDDTDEVLTVHAYFEPLLLETMSKDLDSILAGKLDSLSGLKSWRTLHMPHQNLGAKQFSVFLPPEAPTSQGELGQVYDVLEIQTAPDSKGSLSTNRYYPPTVSGNEVTIHALLSMFHPRPFVNMRFSPRGAAATVRAYNDQYLDIVFRIHAEFQLNEPPFYPYWFTPAQFTGHVIVSRDGGHVEYFHMYVPTDKKLNVDMEWMYGPRDVDSMEVDIGYLPKMEARLAAPSRPAKDGDVDNRDETVSQTDTESVANGIVWSEQISEKDARNSLELKLYPFKKVTYHNFTDLFALAQKENKLVHQVLLWGALDDQSC